MAIPNDDEWKSVFVEVFKELDHCPIHKSAHGSFDAQHPLVYNTKGEATYKCGKCKRTWHSINGLVEFEYRLSRGTNRKNSGEVLFGSVKLILNGQKCKGNSCQQEFVKPVFQNESIHFVLEKLLVKVKQKFYECDVDDLANRFSNLQNNYNPAGRGSHIPELCEGCQKGLCQSKATTNYDKDVRAPTLYGRGFGSYSGTRDIYVKWKISWM